MKKNTINDSVIRGIKLQKRDLETGLSAPQGGATLKVQYLKLPILALPLFWLKANYINSNEVVKTVTTGADGSITTAADLLPYGSYHVDEVTAPDGYLPEGNPLSRSFSITENGSHC